MRDSLKGGYARAGRWLWIGVKVAAVVGVVLFVVVYWDGLMKDLTDPAPTWLVILAALYVVSRNAANAEAVSAMEENRAAHKDGLKWLDAEANRLGLPGARGANAPPRPPEPRPSAP